MHAASQECTFPCSCVLESSLETLLESSVRRFSWVLFFRHAWLNLLSEHISAGRINQVSWPNRDSSSKYRGFSREHTQTFHTRNRAVFEIFTQNHTFLKNGRDFVCARETAEDSCIKNFCKKFFYLNFFECTKNGRGFVCARWNGRGFVYDPSRRAPAGHYVEKFSKRLLWESGDVMSLQTSLKSSIGSLSV